MNQKSKLFILVLAVAALILACFFITTRLNQAVDQGQELLDKNREDVYAQPGFSNPQEQWGSEDEERSGKVRMISEAEFDRIEEPAECTALHWDVNGEEMAAFIETHINDWYAGEWDPMEASIYNVGEDGSDETYYNRIRSLKLYDSGASVLWEMTVNYDAVSGRVHSIACSLPDTEAMRQAFVDIMREMDEEAAGSEMFDKVFKGLSSLEWDNYIAYDQDGYHIYLMREEYTSGMKKQKRYWLSVSPQEL